jgi:bacillithiol biosynthesis cysteine-adding enzyme BshC
LKVIASIEPSLPPLIRDYLAGASSLSAFYDINPNIESIAQSAAKRSFPAEMRKTLVERLRAQHNGLKGVSEATIQNIDALADPSVFTVTTGHQLCVLGGPLFFLYKILSTVKLARMLDEKGVTAVPVYWMASEDHDLEEANHLYLGKEKITWSTKQTGPVGRMQLNEFELVFKQLETLLAHDPLALESIVELRGIYKQENNLAQATRSLVYKMFSHLGVVVIDADDLELKRSFLPVMREELLAGDSQRAVNDTSRALEELGYTTQVSPRTINLFWMETGERQRIEKTSSGFATADGIRVWDRKDFESEVESDPRKLSPNVVLRPVYQEFILPNLAYVGGPGELSYWLQLKGVFRHHQTPFPALVLRDGVTVLNGKACKRMQQLDLKADDVKVSKHDLFERMLRVAGTHEHLLDVHEERIRMELSDLLDKLSSWDPSLHASASAEEKRILNRLTVLRKKIVRVDRRQNGDLERRIGEWCDWVAPEGNPQERYFNWLNVTSVHRLRAFTDGLLDAFNPLERKHRVLSED